METVELKDVTETLQRIIPDIKARDSVVALLRSAQKAYAISGLEVPVGIIGSSVVGKEGADVDIYLKTSNLYQRQLQEPHGYIHMGKYENFMKELQKLLKGKNEIHNLFDESQLSQLPKYKYGYSFSVGPRGIEIEIP